MKWVKLHTLEWLEGSIRVDLTPPERSIWADLLAMAGLCRREGHIERSQGIPYSVDDLAARFTVPVELVQSTLNKCVAEGRMQRNGDGTFTITNWPKYQALPDGKHNGRQKVIKQPQLLSPKPNIFTIYEQNIGLITPMIADRLKVAEQAYPPEWIPDAFKEAVEQNVRKWSYVSAILERWKNEGRGSRKEKKPLKKKLPKYDHRKYRLALQAGATEVEAKEKARIE